MKAIILAAGSGRRLEALTEHTPKCLIRVGNQTIIDYQLQSLGAAHIKDISIVLGYKSEMIKSHLARYNDFKFTFFDNPNYAITNTAYSLLLAIQEMTDDFIYLNGDVLYHPEVIRRLNHAVRENPLAIIRKKTGDEEVKVVLNGIRIRSIGKKIQRGEAYGEFIGVGRFSGNIIGEFKNSLKHTVRSCGGEKAYFEEALNRILDSATVTSLDITDLPCIEIDFPQDLHEARSRIIHEISNEKTDKKKTKILFYIERNLHLPFLEPIHDYLSANCNLDLAFSSPPHRISHGNYIGHGLTKEEISKLKQKGTFYERPEDFKADVAVIADACFFPVRHCKKIVNVGHGLISKGWFYTDSPAVRRENLADLICVPGTWHKGILEKNVFSPITITGFIKSDSFYNCNDQGKDDFYKRYNIPRGVKLILFAPTFNEELSTIPCVKERIAEIADDTALLLIKLHGMTDKKWVRMYREMAAYNRNVRFIEDNDYALSMICADVMVSDVSSAYVEFMLLDKPVVLFNNPMQKSYCQYKPDDIEYRIRDAGIQVATVEEIKNAVRESLGNPGAYGNKRRAYAAALNYSIDGQSVQRAADAILSVMDRDQKTFSEKVLFSIILRYDALPDVDQLRTEISALQRQNRGNSCEFILPGSPSDSTMQALWEMTTGGNNFFISCTDLTQALQTAKGDYIILLKHDTTLPPLWIKWIHNYFKWHPDAGAVKTFSSRNQYRELLAETPYSRKLSTLSEISEYFMYALMGNDIPADDISGDDECIMLSRQSCEAVRGLMSNSRSYDPIFEFGNKLKHAGFTLWNAVEVFSYPTPQTSVSQNKINVIEKHSGTTSSNEKMTLTTQDSLQTEQLLAEHMEEEDVKMAPSCVLYDENITQARTSAKPSCADLIASARMHKKNKDYHLAIAVLEKAKEVFDDPLLLFSRTNAKAGNDNEDEKLNLLTIARKFKKEKNYASAIDVLEKIKSSISQSQEQKNSSDMHAAKILLQHARVCKVKKEYANSIGLLENAKQKIAL